MHSLTNDFFKAHPEEISPVLQTMQNPEVNEPSIREGGYDFRFLLDTVHNLASKAGILQKEWDNLVSQQKIAEWNIANLAHDLDLTKNHLKHLDADSERRKAIKAIKSSSDQAVASIDSARKYEIDNLNERCSLIQELGALEGSEEGVGPDFAPTIRRVCELGNADMARRDLSAAARATLSRFNLVSSYNYSKSVKHDREIQEARSKLHINEDEYSVEQLKLRVVHLTEEVESKTSFLTDHIQGLEHQLNRIRFSYYENFNNLLHYFNKLEALHMFKYESSILSDPISIEAAEHSPDALVVIQLALDKLSRLYTETLLKTLNIRLAYEAKFSETENTVNLELKELINKAQIDATTSRVYVNGVTLFSDGRCVAPVYFRYLINSEYLEGHLSVNNCRMSERIDLVNSGRMLTGCPLGELSLNRKGCLLEKITVEVSLNISSK